MHQFWSIIESMTDKAVATIRRIGQGFGTIEVLDQHDIYVAGYQSHGHQLVEYGYVGEDDLEVHAAMDALLSTDEGRAAKTRGQRVATAGRRDLLAEGKPLVRSAITLFQITAQRLGQSKNPQEQDVARHILATLAQVGSIGDDREALLHDISRCAETLTLPAISQHTDSRGGLKLSGQLLTLADELRAANRASGAGVVGTPAETADLNVIKGFLVQRYRAARKAARAVARERHTPHIANAFDLRGLYPHRHASKAKTEAPKAEQPPQTEQAKTGS